ncbi:FKBP-type peptidyl-prolyl cis-trans isomerase [Desulfuromonas acetexigens]|uniref:Peptidyl-prolyl cis-trans isomerase n=1 Tax=Trichloromonas acetexigens TaxID=38815 RepID=A0A550JAR0_9BACT|nr:peptidylprolyl isomerase [Desulfuromonas acetexigens]TRO80287.1 peptidylprolyl isomerase [Desulfuromonas acetexigens]
MAGAKKGDQVKVFYVGRLADGSVFDSSEGQAPLEFIVGRKEVIRGFDQAVLGMTPGEVKTLTLPAEQAYGPYQEDMVAEVQRADVPAQLKLVVGNHLELTREDGEPIVVKIIALDETKVTLDANHPLAGQDLTFEIRLLDIL